MTHRKKTLQKVCVYCASSERSDRIYLDSARRLGEILAENSITVVYGGGAIGSMGQLAEGALSKGGKVIGVIPRFMRELEWDHKGLTELQIVENMRERKHIMLTDSDAAIALARRLRHARRINGSDQPEAPGHLFESDRAGEHTRIL